jgi:hypothetical protein
MKKLLWARLDRQTVPTTKAQQYLCRCDFAAYHKRHADQCNLLPLPIRSMLLLVPGEAEGVHRLCNPSPYLTNEYGFHL